MLQPPASEPHQLIKGVNSARIDRHAMGPRLLGADIDTGSLQWGLSGLAGSRLGGLLNLFAFEVDTLATKRSIAEVGSAFSTGSGGDDVAGVGVMGSSHKLRPLSMRDMQ